MPHMLTVDKEGAVWVADVGRHQVGGDEVLGVRARAGGA